MEDIEIHDDAKFQQDYEGESSIIVFTRASDLTLFEVCLVNDDHVWRAAHVIESPHAVRICEIP